MARTVRLVNSVTIHDDIICLKKFRTSHGTGASSDSGICILQGESGRDSLEELLVESMLPLFYHISLESRLHQCMG